MIGVMRGNALAVLAAVLFVIGCGGDSNVDSEMVRTGTPTVEVRPDGTLTANPAPLTLADVEGQPAASARRAVYELLFWGQWGSWPNVLDAYDPEVRATVGTRDLLGAYAVLQPQLVAAQAQIVSAVLRRGRAIVLLELRSTSARQRESFLLRRRGASWRILSDTLLERGLRAYVTQRVDTGPNPSRAAARAGVEAAEKYRALFTRGDSAGTDPNSGP